MRSWNLSSGTCARVIGSLPAHKNLKTSHFLYRNTFPWSAKPLTWIVSGARFKPCSPCTEGNGSIIPHPLPHDPHLPPESSSPKQRNPRDNQKRKRISSINSSENEDIPHTNYFSSLLLGTRLFHKAENVCFSCCSAHSADLWLLLFLPTGHNQLGGMPTYFESGSLNCSSAQDLHTPPSQTPLHQHTLHTQ